MTDNELPSKKVIEDFVYNIIPIDTVILCHKQMNKGHWFDEDSKRFFRSRHENTARLSEKTNIAYFISSEQFVTYYPYHKSPRKYTIRRVDMNTGAFLMSIDNTIFEFQYFARKPQATKALLNYLKNEDLELTEKSKAE